MSIQKPWDWERAVALARIIAYARAWNGTTVVGIAAGLLHGMNSSESTQTIDLADSGRGRGRRETLPPIVLGRATVAPACALVLHPGGQTAGMARQEMFGAQVLDLEGAVTSAVLLSPDEAGFVAACEGLRVLTGFSRPALYISRAREARVRKALLQKLEGSEREFQGLVAKTRGLGEQTLADTPDPGMRTPGHHRGRLLVPRQIDS